MNTAKSANLGSLGINEAQVSDNSTGLETQYEGYVDNQIRNVCNLQR